VSRFSVNLPEEDARRIYLAGQLKAASERIDRGEAKPRERRPRSDEERNES
jgi:hypothetical protein